MLHTYNSHLMSLPSINFLHFTVSEIQPGQDFIGQRLPQQGQRSHQGHNDVAHLQLPPNVPTKYQLPTTYGFRDIARTRFYTSRSLRPGPRSNQDHTMKLYTYNPQPMSLPRINFLPFRDIARTRFYRSRSLQQGQRSHQGHTMTLHTYTPQPMSLLCITFLHRTVSEI